MKRPLSGLLLATAAVSACVNLSDSGPQLFLAVVPVLDSVFVGSTLPARSVYLDDGAGHHSDPGPITWSISPQSVATIDPTTGQITGVSRGTAVAVATRTDGVATGAVINVYRPLDLILQMDTIVVMPGDTITLPVDVKKQAPGPIDPPVVRFDTSSAPGVYTIDTTTGLVTAVGTGGPVRYVARLRNGADSVVDTGAVVVMTLTDTTETGRSFMTAFGTAIRHQRGVPLARKYPRLNPEKWAFQLADTVYAQPVSGAVHEKVLITLPDTFSAPGRFEIDSISPQQAATQINQLNPFCQPTFPWALWFSFLPTPEIHAYSHGTPTDSVAGYLTITQIVPALATPPGRIVSGRYQFRAQRVDLYGDPLGAETIRGTFVAPLWTLQNTCGS